MKQRVTNYLLVFLCGFLAAASGGCGKKQAADVSAQIAAIKGTDKDKREDAMVQLATMQEAAVGAIPTLLETLQDADGEIRRLAAYALGEMGSPAIKTIPELRKLLNDPDRSVVSQAISSIAKLDPKAPEAKMKIPNVMTQ